jgi:Xaa-Pro aminopeptidase
MPSTTVTSKESFNAKLKAARRYLKSIRCSSLLFECPADLYYWTGLAISMGSVVITPRSITLYVDGRYIGLCREKVELSVRPHTQLQLGSGLCAFDSSCTSYARYLALKKAHPHVKLKPVDSLGPFQRMKKLPSEIEKMEKACALAVNCIGEIRKHLKPGITEKEVALHIERFYSAHEASPSFEPIIAFGSNSAMPHSKPTERKLEQNDIALVDLGCKKDGYCSDMTRTFLIGKPKSPCKKIYTAVYNALHAALDKLKAGATPHQLDAAAKAEIIKAGFEPYPHSLGHGVGIDVHELPRVSPSAEEPLTENMVITIEPGIYIDGLAGVRLENQVVVLKEGYKNLTPFPFEL